MSSKERKCTEYKPIPFEDIKCNPSNHFGNVVKSIRINVNRTLKDIIKKANKL